ncbi:MAG: adenylyl-sulfate kinase, partial [Marmoricola sp.]
MPAPQFCPSPRELDDLELLLSGALAPRTTFDVSDPGITLALPADLQTAPEVELVDPEGLPLALLTPAGLTPLGAPTYGPFRRLHLTPAQAREQYAGALLVPFAAPLTEADLDAIRSTAGQDDVVLLALNGTGTPQGVSSVGLVRTALVAAALLEQAGTTAHVVAAPLPSHGDPDYDHQLGSIVADSYATSDV